MKLKPLILAGALMSGTATGAGAQDINGAWDGAISIAGGQIPMTVHFAEDGTALSATIDIQGATGVPLQNVSRSADSLHFELAAGLGLAVFEGTIAGDSISGSFSQSGSRGTFSLTPLEANADEPIDPSTLNETERDVLGRWEGEISVSGVTIPMVVHFEATGRGFGATADMQGATGLRLQSVSADTGRVHFELMGGPGLAVFDGEMSGSVITGRFSQGFNQGTFRLSRGPQSAEPDEETELPYAVEDIEFGHDTISLAGTLTIPREAGPHPAVVLITGSGAQNRDEEIFGFKIFRVIADHLTRNGVAVLRYDDRGMGGSNGNVAASTSADFAADVLSAVEYLKDRGDIAGGGIGLLGHSEGGVVAPIAATRSDDVAFIVLMAGTAVPGSEVLYEQSRLILAANGASEHDLRLQREVQEAMFAAMRGEGTWDAAKEKVIAQLRDGINQMSPEQRESITDTAAFFESRATGALNSVKTPWFRFFVDYDPGPTLARVSVPVLALFGGKDLQVPPAQNAPVMEAALEEGGNGDFQIRTFPEANHLFQAANTGSPSEYGTLAKEFVDGFLDTVSAWILEHTS